MNMPYTKSDRERIINVLCEKVAMTNDPNAKKELLTFIEGERYFSPASGKKIILFNGPPRSGKDTACTFALNHLGKRGGIYRFASPLKDGLHTLFGFEGVDTEFFSANKDTPNPIFTGKSLQGKEILTPRDAYIWISEECIKPVFGKDFFARVAVRNIEKIKKNVIVVPDLGFREEAELLIEKFGKDNVIIVHLHREGCQFISDSVKDSRRYVTEIGCQKFIILNNDSVHELHSKVIEMLDAVAPQEQ